MYEELISYTDRIVRELAKQLKPIGDIMSELESIIKSLYTSKSKYLENYKYHNRIKKFKSQVTGNKLTYVRCRNNL
ncbi:hypothetical protein [Terrisporobacter hibernicus]|uniref:Transposase n=1 Tax=Terrisporobacter hibernicus TaxID=2813371 RepID=A0AAX2ZE29_9FIRM|nr:hypothetical protein [Terrisporobacter hibernicus]UEL47574.1 hypothetical protein JW646_18445 [Terrisporobacter hibernicus]